MNQPYRIAAEMPVEEKEKEQMSETHAIWKMILIAIVSVVGIITGYCVFDTIHKDQTVIRKAQIESTPDAKDAAQARYLEAKALSDKAMFEQMNRAEKK